jgi:hypothetical protein
MTTDDDKISRRYRELAREEPPRHVDEAMLAAARRAAEARPAPLVAPSGRRWYFPLAAAAVIVLAVAVTVHVERQQTGVEVAEAPVAASEAPREEKKPAAQAPAEPKRELFAADPKRAPAPDKREMAPRTDAPQAPAPAGAAPAAAPPEAPATGARDSVRADAAARPQPRAEAQSAMRQRSAELAAVHASPEQWLQGIADLRRQGRHEEADKTLAEFRRAYPDYRIPEAMLEKVERQK